MLRLTLLAIALGTALAQTAQSAPLNPTSLTATGSVELLPAGLQLSGVVANFTMPSDKPERTALPQPLPRNTAIEPGDKPVHEVEISL